MSNTNTRAIKGGQFGANGEWYEGGKFINTVPENAKREGSRPAGIRKQEIEPYKWVAVVPGQISIYGRLAGIYGRVIDGLMVLDINPQVLAYYGDDESKIKDLAARYNRGERLVRL